MRKLTPSKKSKWNENIEIEITGLKNPNNLNMIRGFKFYTFSHNKAVKYTINQFKEKPKYTMTNLYPNK